MQAQVLDKEPRFRLHLAPDTFFRRLSGLELSAQTVPFAFVYTVGFLVAIFQT